MKSNNSKLVEKIMVWKSKELNKMIISYGKEKEFHADKIVNYVDTIERKAQLW